MVDRHMYTKERKWKCPHCGREFKRRKMYARGASQGQKRSWDKVLAREINTAKQDHLRSCRQKGRKRSSAGSSSSSYSSSSSGGGGGCIVGFFKLLFLPFYGLYKLIAFLFRRNPLHSYWLPITIVIILAFVFLPFWWVWIPVLIIAGLDWYSKSKGAAKITTTLSHVDAMDGGEFELFLVHLFTALGYSASHTGQSGDFGADLVLEGKDGRVAVQAKNYDTSNVGNDAVQQAIAAASYYNCDRAMVVTNSHYTKAAIEQAAGSNPAVILVDREDLGKLLERARV